MKKTAGWMVLLIAAAGCASGQGALRTACARPDEMAILCRHCNCTMPADVDPDSNCAVCNCGYTAGRCVRGK